MSKLNINETRIQGEISSEEALKDIEPYFTEDEIKNLLEKSKQNMEKNEDEVSIR